jgi:hypothetical protein
MTLVVSLLNENVAIHLSDRRLTGGVGPVTDEANKTIFLNALDSRLVMGFSGLARAGRIDMEDRILDLLFRLAPPDFQWLAMKGRFTDALSGLFQEPAIRKAEPEKRATSIHFVGFLRSDPPRPVSTFISNHNDPVNRLSANPPADVFRETTSYLETGDPTNTLAQAMGLYQHIGAGDMAPLLTMMKDGRPPDAVVGKGLDLFRKWADDPKAESGIGKQIMSVVLPSDHSEWATSRYHTNVVQPTTYSMSEVYALPWQHLAIKGGPLLTEISGKAGFVPKVRRNEPCPCGSGKKYKRCHDVRGGKQLIMELELVKTPGGVDPNDD